MYFLLQLVISEICLLLPGNMTSTRMKGPLNWLPNWDEVYALFVVSIRLITEYTFIDPKHNICYPPETYVSRRDAFRIWGLGEKVSKVCEIQQLFVILVIISRIWVNLIMLLTSPKTGAKRGFIIQKEKWGWKP